MTLRSPTCVARTAVEGHRSAHRPVDKRFVDRTAWTAHLEALGVTAYDVQPNPVCIATEAALWGSIAAHGLLRNTVIVSDGADSSTSASMRCAGSMPNGSCTSSTLSPSTTGRPKRHPGSDMGALCRSQGLRARPNADGQGGTGRAVRRHLQVQDRFVMLDRLLKRLHAKKPICWWCYRPDIPLTQRSKRYPRPRNPRKSPRTLSDTASLRMPSSAYKPPKQTIRF